MTPRNGAGPQVELIPAQRQDERTIENLLQLYLHDFTDFMDWDVDERGRYSVDDLHMLWLDDRRHPFLLVVDGMLAGFAIVDGWSVLDDTRTGVTDMGEFFVMQVPAPRRRPHRRAAPVRDVRRGVGSARTAREHRRASVLAQHRRRIHARDAGRGRDAVGHCAVVYVSCANALTLTAYGR